jgi:hypothetical protein
LEEALALRRESLEISEKLAMDFQSKVDYQIALARGYRSMGNLLVEKAKYIANVSEAEALHDEAKTQYLKIVNFAVCRDVFARAVPQIVKLQEEVKQDLLSLDLQPR